MNQHITFEEVKEAYQKTNRAPITHEHFLSQGGKEYACPISVLFLQHAPKVMIEKAQESFQNSGSIVDNWADSIYGQMYRDGFMAAFDGWGSRIVAMSFCEPRS